MTKSDRYVVFAQETDDVSRVQAIYGPFNSYDHAVAVAGKLRQKNPELWHGIRVLLSIDND